MRYGISRSMEDVHTQPLLLWIVCVSVCILFVHAQTLLLCIPQPVLHFGVHVMDCIHIPCRLCIPGANVCIHKQVCCAYTHKQCCVSGVSLHVHGFSGVCACNKIVHAQCNKIDFYIIILYYRISGNFRIGKFVICNFVHYGLP